MKGLVEGTEIEAKYMGRGKFYPGKVEAVNADGTFAVLFDDGDKDSSVKAENINVIAAGPAAAGSDGQIMGAAYNLKRNGEEVSGCFQAADLAHGFDGWLPLHAAAALALDKEALSLLLEAHTDAAATADAGGKYPFELLPSGASDDAATLLFKASGKPARPLREALELSQIHS